MTTLSGESNRALRNSFVDEMYRAGASHKAIAEATGMTINSVACLISRRIKKGLLVMRAPGGFAQSTKPNGKGRERNSELIQDQVNEVVRYVYLGLTNYEIAEKMGLTMVQVQCRLAKARQAGLVDGRRPNVCSNCQRPGHNSQTCSNLAV